MTDRIWTGCGVLAEKLKQWQTETCVSLLWWNIVCHQTRHASQLSKRKQDMNVYETDPDRMFVNIEIISIFMGMFLSLANWFYWCHLKANAASVHANVYRAIMPFLFILCVCVTLTDENQKQEIFRLRFFPLCCCVNGNCSFCQYLRVSETTTKFLSLTTFQELGVVHYFYILKKKKKTRSHPSLLK